MLCPLFLNFLLELLQYLVQATIIVGCLLCLFRFFFQAIEHLVLTLHSQLTSFKKSSSEPSKKSNRKNDSPDLEPNRFQNIKEEVECDQERHNVVEIIQPFLFLGDRFATYDLAEGNNPWKITCVINVADNFVAPIYPKHLNLSTYHFPMRDEYEPNFISYLLQVIEIVNTCVKNTDKKERILIHCKHGRNRSVAILAGYLLKEGYVYSLDDAMNWIQKRCKVNRCNSIHPKLQYVKSLLQLVPQCLTEFSSPQTETTQKKSKSRRRIKRRSRSLSPKSHESRKRARSRSRSSKNTMLMEDPILFNANEEKKEKKTE